MTLFRSEGANYDETAGQGTLPIDVRRGYEGLFSSTGVLPSSDSPLVEGAEDFTYTVHTGYWVTSRGGSDGYHYWGNIGDLSVPTSVAPAAGLSRIDIIYALHPSAGENGDTSSEPVVAVAVGTEASSPVAPTLPVGALELARNTMTSSATSTASAGNTITQSAAKARLVEPSESSASSESFTKVAIGSGSYSASAALTPAVNIAAAPYPRVVELECEVHASVTAGAAAYVVLTSSGSALASAVRVSQARFPFAAGTAIGGSTTVYGTFDLPAGATAAPRAWVEQISGTTNVAGTGSEFRVRVRPAGTRDA